MIGMLKAFLIVIAVLTAVQIDNAQNVMLIGRLNEFDRTTDLSKELEKRCFNEIREQVGSEINLQIRYDNASSRLIKSLASKLKESILETLNFSIPSDPATIRIYIARVRTVPASYQVASPLGVNFVYPIVYDGKSDLSVD